MLPKTSAAQLLYDEAMLSWENDGALSKVVSPGKGGG